MLNNNVEIFSKEWGESTDYKGEVFTQPKIIESILDFVGLLDSTEILRSKILEPSCGSGDFVISLAQRITNTDKLVPASKMLDVVTAYDISPKNIKKAKDRLKDFLNHKGYSDSDSSLVAEAWLHCSDFLLEPINTKYTHVVGNPPYIRIERIPSALLAQYRLMFSTMVERADIYVAFYQKALDLLVKEGSLGFICSDRWTKGRYGSALRDYIFKGFSLDLFLDMHGVDAFADSVSAYTSITVIRANKKDNTTVISEWIEDETFVADISESLKTKKSNRPEIKVRKDLVNGSQPWVIASEDILASIRDSEHKFPVLEDTGCKVYIGAATGNNKVYIVDSKLEIEEDRKLPVVIANDITDGQIVDQGKSIINVYKDGNLIDLDDYPMLKEYLESHQEVLSKRHVAKNNPTKWFKTIDKVHEDRAVLEKLLIPDIKSDLVAAIDAGNYHPNNSIYYVVSEHWDLRALKAIFISGIAKLFVEAYSTKIGGGYLRFQAQHLRRIRLPQWSDLEINVQEQLIEAGENNNIFDAAIIAADIYGIDRNLLVGE